MGCPLLFRMALGVRRSLAGASQGRLAHCAYLHLDSNCFLAALSLPELPELGPVEDRSDPALDAPGRGPSTTRRSGGGHAPLWMVKPMPRAAVSAACGRFVGILARNALTRVHSIFHSLWLLPLCCPMQNF